MELKSKEITDVNQLISALKEKEGIASEYPWVYLATLLFGNASPRTISLVVATINRMENK